MRQKIMKGAILACLLLVSCASPPQGIVILCAGDSITEAEYPRHLRRMLSQDGLRAKVLNCGRKGYTSREYLKFLSQKKRDLAAEHPDYILLQLGTNDVRVDGDFTPAEEFERTMREIIAVFGGFRNRRGGSSQLLLATIPPLPGNLSYPFNTESAERVVKEINPILKKIATEENLVLVDNYSLFLEQPQFLPDVHPTSEGYRLLARNWYNSLKPLISR
jgi:lysophospholipase L1-like esterase